MLTQHTDKKYGEDLKKLREDILYMGGLVEDQIQKAVSSLVDRDSKLAETIIERDHEVNRLDVEIDDLCIQLLALHQPAARDLRFITTALKITTDLERIGDMAVNICERALELNEEPQLKPYIDLRARGHNARAQGLQGRPGCGRPQQPDLSRNDQLYDRRSTYDQPRDETELDL